MTNQSIIQSIDENQAAKILGVAVAYSGANRHPIPIQIATLFRSKPPPFLR